MKRIIGVNSNVTTDIPSKRRWKGSAGQLPFCELTATKGWTEHVFPTMSFAYLNSVKKKLKETA
jgi:hypothetical protein